MAEKETPKTISVFATEYYETSLFREAVDINIEDYTELEGMTREEAIDYIESNAWEMKSTNEEMYESLGDELMDMDIRRDKITNESQDINAE